MEITRKESLEELEEYTDLEGVKIIVKGLIESRFVLSKTYLDLDLRVGDLCIEIESIKETLNKFGDKS